MSIVKRGEKIPLRPIVPGGTQGQIGWCATCNNYTIDLQRRVWIPDTVRVTFKCRGYAGSISITFCKSCFLRLDEGDFEPLVDWVWRGWRRAALLAGMPDEMWEEKVRLYSEFEILYIEPVCQRVNDAGRWEDMSLEEARAK